MTNDLISREAPMDEISAALLNARFTSVRTSEQHEEKIQRALDLVGETPTVDVAPVAHGRWIEAKGAIRCSECMNEPLYDYHGRLKLSMACPHCGAKMEVEHEAD
jgi:hypothetical protein